MNAPERIWPDKLRIRDTGIIHEEEGQRIYTTVGRGYEKREYIRADLVEARIAAAEAAVLMEAARLARAAPDGEIAYDDILALIPDERN